MSDGIFVLTGGGNLRSLSERPYDSEDLLQGLIAKYPGILAGDQISPSEPRKWLLVGREAGIPGEEGGGSRWSLDHLFLDQDGIPTFVEVKRSSDTRIRREVVGQMLDYAANAQAYWSLESIIANFEQTCNHNDVEPSDVLADLLEDAADPGAYWQTVKTNLQAGRIRMLFVADIIPDELRRIVEFLNKQMDPAECLAIQIKQFADDDIQTLVPRVIGQSVEAERRRGRSQSRSKEWDEVSFFEEMKSSAGETGVRTARKILDWIRPKVDKISGGRGTTAASLIVIHNRHDKEHYLFNLNTGFGTSAPSVQIQFFWESQKLPFSDSALRVELLNKLNDIPGVAFPSEAITGKPKIPLATLEGQEAFRKFMAAIDWMIRQIELGNGEHHP